ISDVIQNPEAEHDVERCEVVETIEQVAKNELVAVAGHVVMRHVLFRLAHQVWLVFHPHYMDGAVGESGEGEASIVTREIENPCTVQESPVLLDERVVAPVQTLNKVPRLTGFDEARILVEETRYLFIHDDSIARRVRAA